MKAPDITVPEDSDAAYWRGVAESLAAAGDKPGKAWEQAYDSLAKLYAAERRRADHLQKACDIFEKNSEACVTEYEGRLKAEQRVDDLTMEVKRLLEANEFGARQAIELSNLRDEEYAKLLKLVENACLDRHEMPGVNVLKYGEYNDNGPGPEFFDPPDELPNIPDLERKNARLQKQLNQVLDGLKPLLERAAITVTDGREMVNVGVEANPTTMQAVERLAMTCREIKLEDHIAVIQGLRDNGPIDAGDREAECYLAGWNECLDEVTETLRRAPLTNRETPCPPKDPT